jgi:hypothetical protein
LNVALTSAVGALIIKTAMWEKKMGKNPPPGPGRKGEVKSRSQFQNPVTKLWVKRNDDTGKFMDNKTTGGKFKGIRREK